MGTTKGTAQSVISIPQFTTDIGYKYDSDTIPTASPNAGQFAQAVAAAMTPPSKPSSPAAPVASGTSGSGGSAVSSADGKSISVPAASVSTATSVSSTATDTAETNPSPAPLTSAPTPASSANAGSREVARVTPYPISRPDGTMKQLITSKSERQEAIRSPDAEKVHVGRPDWLDELENNPMSSYADLAQKFLYNGMSPPETT